MKIRLDRVVEVQELIRAMIELGWCLEEARMTDEENQPLRVELKLRHDEGSGDVVL